MSCKTCAAVRRALLARLARIRRKREPKPLRLPGPPYRNIPPEQR